MISETAAGLYMMMKMKFQNTEIPYLREKPPISKEYEYQQKADEKELKEEYEKSKMPESGFMLRSEYEEKSLSKDKNTVEIEPAQTPKEYGMKYVPVPKYKLVKYNLAPGFTELQIPRRLNFDREVNGQGIVSSDFTFMVYPSIHYYASADCTSTDLYVIPLDTSLSNIERVKQANIIRRETKPILSTSKDIDTPYIFRTLTPVDFTPDNKKLLIKEKTGYRFDGIWKTDLWIYDFENKKATALPEVREAIANYWAQTKGANLDESRWDIYPMGFDENNQDRIIVCAYGFTGKAPVFLGTWSIDTKGDYSKLQALSGSSLPVSIVGYKLEYDGNESREHTEAEAERLEKQEKEHNKEVKRLQKEEEKRLEQEYKLKLRQKEMEYLFKQQQYLEEYKGSGNKYNGTTGADSL